jgi:hypothetical protein
LTDALKKSLEAKTFRLWRLEQLLFQHGRLPVCFTQILTLLKNSWVISWNKIAIQGV